MASFPRITVDDFFRRFSRGQRAPIQLAPLDRVARHPFAEDVARWLLIPVLDFTEHDREAGQFKLQESLAHSLYEVAKRTQFYILACGNGMTLDTILTTAAIPPPRHRHS